MSLTAARLTDRHRPASRGGGFTSLELMITMVIAVILIAVAVPQYTQFVQTQKAVSVINNLEDDLQYARSEAMKEGQFVSMCVSSSGTGCTTETWDCGWITYSNPAFLTTPAFATGVSTLLRVGRGAVNSNCGGGSSAPSYTIATSPASTIVTYNRDGFAMGLLTSAPSGQLFTLQSSPTEVTAATRCLWMDVLGRQYIQTAGQTAATGQTGNSCT